MPSRFVKCLRHPWRAAAVLVLVTVAPKCVACLLAYAGLGAWLGLGGPEFCGAPFSSPASPFTGWTTALAWCGFATALGAVVLHTVCRGRAKKSSVPNG